MPEPVLQYQGVNVDEKGYMSFAKEEDYTNAPEWKRFMVGMNNAQLVARGEVEPVEIVKKNPWDMSAEDIVNHFRREAERNK